MIYYDEDIYIIYYALHRSTLMVIVGFGLIRLLIIKVGFQH